MRTADLDYDLPEQLIATEPAKRREAARLMVIRLAGDALRHQHVADLPELLRPGDLLILNDTKVLPARFHAIRTGTGGRIEGLFLADHPQPRGGGAGETARRDTPLPPRGSRDRRASETDRGPRTLWHVMLRSGGRLRPGEKLRLADEHPIELIEQYEDGSWLVARHGDLDTTAMLDRIGAMPLPPYIQRARSASKTGEDRDRLDRQRYQTVYADQPGAVAAPTAGLHFSESLLRDLADAGVRIARLTLHVGMGTFSPVRADRLEKHDMHAERFTVPADTLEQIHRARAEHRRIIPVGTTCVRALESLPRDERLHRDYSAETRLLIQPGFRFRYTDGLMTNFHLPRSTLLALVAARIGLDRLRSCYQAAIENEYRFYSYGDAMLILP